MSKLTLEHLAPYLPYGLKLQTKYGVQPLIGIMFSDDTDYNSTKETKHNINHPLANTDTHCLEFYQVKPILRPMSDFDKPHYDESEFYSFMGELNSTMEKDFIIDRDLDFDIEKPMFVNCSQALKVYDFLFKNHFDVFGLIEQDLAIDINTIKQD